MSTSSGSERAKRLWFVIQEQLDCSVPGWRTRLDSFGQVAGVERREQGDHWTDDEVFQALLRAVLSNNTDWAKVETVLPHLGTLFSGLSLSPYADISPDDIDKRLVPWFRARRAGSLTLRRSLLGLARSAHMLRDWSAQHGSAEHYFLDVLAECDGDPKAAAVQLGKPGSPHKLPALGVPIAAEALRNLGFDLSKPDRHVCRAVGAFGLVSFRRWPDRSRKRAPQGSIAEMLETMRAVESLGRSVRLRPTYVDIAIWLLCARSGAGLANAELAAMAARTNRAPG